MGVYRWPSAAALAQRAGYRQSLCRLIIPSARPHGGTRPKKPTWSVCCEQYSQASRFVAHHALTCAPPVRAREHRRAGAYGSWNMVKRVSPGEHRDVSQTVPPVRDRNGSKSPNSPTTAVARSLLQLSDMFAHACTDRCPWLKRGSAIAAVVGRAPPAHACSSLKHVDGPVDSELDTEQSLVLQDHARQRRGAEPLRPREATQGSSNERKPGTAIDPDGQVGPIPASTGWQEPRAYGMECLVLSLT